MICQKEKRKQFHLQLHQKEYLGIKVIKEVKDLYSENCETLIKEIEDDTNRKRVHANGLEELILLKYPYYPKQSTDS